MKNTKIFLIAALLGSVLAGCQTEIEIEPVEKPVDNTLWTFTVTAAMNPGTKAMSLDGNTLKAYWEEGEIVGVYLGSTKVGTLSVSQINNGEATSAELSGILSGIDGLTTSDSFFLVFPDKEKLTYLGQDGSSPADESKTMANNFDYALATVDISEINTSTHVITAEGNADFTSLQSIYRLRFKDSDGYFKVNSIAITASQNGLVRTMGPVNDLTASDCGTLTMMPTVSPSDNFYYMAIRNENTSNDDTYSFTVVRSTDNAVFEGTKDIGFSVLKKPAYIRVGVSVTQKTMEPDNANTIDSQVDVL